MSGPINSIFGAVTARLATWTNDGDPTATPYADASDWCLLGATNLPAAAVPPRIVWVPTQENFGPAIGQGGDGVTVPRPLATRQSNFTIHLWAAAVPQTGQTTQNAADIDALESLLNAFMWAVYYQVHGAPALPFIGTGRWAGLNVDGSNLACGIGYILPITVNIPVVRPLETTATVTEIDAAVKVPTTSTPIVLT